MADNARQTTQLSESEFVRRRYFNFLGSTQPVTIAAKELADNCTDQLCDGKTRFGYYEIGKDFRSVIAMDGGAGISVRQTIRQDTEKKSTFLYLAVAKLYSSTNYGDQSTGDDSTTVGANGIGTKANNFLSAHFTCGTVAKTPKKHKFKTVSSKSTCIDMETEKERDYSTCFNVDEFNSHYINAEDCVRGYHFQQGNATIDGETPMDEAVPEWIGFNVPRFEGQTDPFGYLVAAQYDDSVIGFGDKIDCDWIRNYIKVRMESCSLQDEDIYFTFRYPVADEEGNVTMKEEVFIRPVNEKEFTKAHQKEINSGRYVILYSWYDQVNDLINDPNNKDQIYGPVHAGFFDIVYAKDESLLKDISNVVNGSIVFNPKHFAYTFEVANTKIRLNIPCVFCMKTKTKKGLAYTDQQKTAISSNRTTPSKMHINNLMKQFEKIPELKEHFQRIANEKYLKGTGKKIHSDFYWNATGGCTAREIFSKNVNTNEDLKFIMNLIDGDPDVLKYAKENGIDLEKLKKSIK